MGLPSSGKPTATQVAEWALNLAKKRITINVDGRYGGQCWDLPNYILKRYWGFMTWGNANAMAQKRQYHGYNFKIYKNTRNFVPKAGDFAVWTGGVWGHVSIVVGTATKSYFYSVDQNWYTNNTSGSPSYKIKHTYNDGPGGVTHFVRPPYKVESKPKPKPQDTPSETPQEKQPETRWKDVTKIKYTTFNQGDDPYGEVTHYVADNGLRKGKVKGLYIKESQIFGSVKDIYRKRDRYEEKGEHPHVYADREMVWHCRHTQGDVPGYEGWLVLEICGGNTDNEREYLLNVLLGMVFGIKMLYWVGMKVSTDVVKVDDKIRRTMKDLINYDMLLNGFPELGKYQDTVKKILEQYAKRDKVFTETISTTTTKTRIKVKSNSSNISVNNTAKSTKETSSSKPKITIERSGYTFNAALNAQMTRGMPMVNNGCLLYTSDAADECVNV